MVTPNFIVEIANERGTRRDPNGLSPEQITDFIERFGNPTSLVGRFGERSTNDRGFDAADIVRILNRDSSWFPA